MQNQKALLRRVICSNQVHLKKGDVEWFCELLDQGQVPSGHYGQFGRIEANGARPRERQGAACVVSCGSPGEHALTRQRRVLRESGPTDASAVQVLSRRCRWHERWHVAGRRDLGVGTFI